MSNPVTGANLSAFYAVPISSGGSDLYAKLDATPVDKVNVYYRVYYHDIVRNMWLFHSDFPWERWFFGIKIKIATRAAPLPRPPLPPEYQPAVPLVDQIKIETHDLTNDIPANTATVIVNVPSPLTTTQQIPSAFRTVCGGSLGDTRGSVNVFWTDLSKFIAGGRITLTKFGVTSIGQRQTLFDQSFTSYPFTLSTDYSSPNFVAINFDLLPPGIQLPDPPFWDPNNPPSRDPRSPMWVVEGDLLTLTLITRTDAADPSNPSGTIQDIQTIWSFRYYHAAHFYQFADSATEGQPYSKQLEIIQDPWVPNPILGTFSQGGPFPPGAWALTSNGLLTCFPGPPVGSRGFYEIMINLLSQGNAITSEPIFLWINIVGTPVMMAPPQTIDLVYGAPFPPQYSLYATNHPTAYQIASGTMPHGLSLNFSTGEITGIPDAEELPHNILFTASNSTGTSAPYLTQWSVTLFAPPIIISPNTLDAFLEEVITYDIVTDRNALQYRAFDLPAGLALIGSVLTGIAIGPTGDYVAGLQAANRFGWGPVFPLQIHVGIAPPVITSPLDLVAPIDEAFEYQISATHTPMAYGAGGLPVGLSINTVSGEITGVPLDPGTSAIALTAINQGGTGRATLNLEIVLPDRPVIDTTSTHGRVITGDTTHPFMFRPTASHSPTSWSIDTRPPGLNFSRVDGSLTGIWSLGGLYALSFIASNSGGDSDPGVFNFLISLSAQQAEQINELGTIVELWINLENSIVTVGTGTQPDPTQPPTTPSMTVKRGDTTEIHVLFHEDGVPSDIDLQTLKFGIKAAYDDEFVVFTDSYSLLTGGRFRIFPDFSGTNDDLDAILVAPTTTLLAEIQWEMFDDNPPPNQQLLRRSSQTFQVNILRDLIHPD